MSYALNAKAGYRDGDADTTYIASTLKSQRGKAGGGIGPEETLVAAPLSHGSNPNSNMAGRRREDDHNLVTAFDTYNQTTSDTSQTLRDPNGTFGDALPAVSIGASVRRLTPTECERLQAFPDGWTRVPDSAPDSRRYAGLGDAVTASVGEWLGRRILNADRAAA